MPKVEIDESEFNQLRALQGVAAKIVANPKGRQLLEQAHKLVDPNAATPTLDAEVARTAPIDALREEFSKKFDELSKGQEEKERQARIDAIISKQAKDKAALRAAGWLDDGISKIEKIMEEKGLLEVEDALAIFERHNPPAVAATPSGIGSWGFTDTSGDADKNIQDLISTRGQNDQIADRMAREALAEFRGALGRR